MIRISGINISKNKNLLIALTSIFGIGKSRARSICLSSNINENIKIKNLDKKQIDIIRKYISKFIIESDLRREINLNIKRLIDINCYRGIRHRRNLPIHGQRTKTNAKTCKKKNKKIKK
ncbi:30S ribosomal protein S13 [Enterobacterales bacterium endosymbiont of Anomoneura mori]|uniref:30S ribosomal protein S13 n=1 Tax=Enterobacterales bacterium endosymbiont of Anomoneura mori TaxID=3132096 RepID=UPI00399D0795